MTADLIAAWLHYLGAFALAGGLMAQMVLLSGGVDRTAALRIAQLDMFYAAAAILVLAGGLMRVFWGARGLDFYLQNGMFHLKITLFILVGLLSVVPTVAFLKWRRAARADPAWTPAPAQVKRAKILVHVELTGLLLIIVVASLVPRAFTL